MTIWSVQDMLSTADSPIDTILADRKLDTQDLNPDLANLHDPYLMKGMREAAVRTKQAIESGEKIRIAGDYDADGITSTSTMMINLSEVGANVDYDIPDRKDGYGLSNKMIDRAHEDGITLIITCDNGITAYHQVEYAKSKGIDVIITDHHEPQGDSLPDTTVVNPMQEDCPYPFKKLAGCAVAWKFCQAVLSEFQGMAPALVKSYDTLDLVTIGTVADVMDLVGENRIIVHHGLSRINKTNHIGLQSLLKALDINKDVTAGTIGFTIGPALNATGRLVSAKEAVEMILQKSRLKALRSAKYLSDLNKERKEWTEYYTKELEAQLEPDKPINILIHPEIPEGIIGIIASRIKESTNKPTLIMAVSDDGEFYKGSGRSIPEYNLFANLMPLKHLFIGVGGHAMACGFSIGKDKVDELKQALYEGCTLTEDDLTPKLLIDYDIDHTLVTMELAEELSVLEPFGKGNPKPTFCMTDVKVLSYKPMGKNQNHLRLEIAADTEMFSCIGWNMIDKMNELAKGKSEVWLDIAFKPGINEWNNRKSLQLQLEDIREAQN